jgi:uncharacterized protein YdaU (DUF1376 family)
MAPQKSPAFQFYAKDFATGTASMSLQEVGAYIRLLCYQWDVGSVPSDASERARILGCAKAQERELWKKVGQKFALRNDVYLNERMEDERQKQAEYRRRQSDRGKASAASKGNQRSNAGSTSVEPPLQPDTQPLVNQSSTLRSSSSSSSPNSSKNDELGGRTPTLIARGESVKFDRKHGNHVPEFCGWACLDREQLDELAGKVPGDDLQLKRGQIIEWARAIRQLWSDRIVPDGSHFDFWRNRWTEQHGGSRPANATLKAKQAERSIDEAFR